MSHTIDRKTPEGADQYFALCISGGDLAAAMSCYDPDAVYVGRDGQAITGLAEIERSMAKLCSAKLTLRGTAHQATVVGELALWLDTWTLSGANPDGSPLEMKGGSACLMRQGPDGIWRWLVNRPFSAPFFEAVV